ncbi:hypothetical protein [Burkholderia anthina]|uniref:hypothetical protein n=1 Tax=Burkholderia anthina TaxID=179879 RepID=UPI0037BE3CF0
MERFDHKTTVTVQHAVQCCLERVPTTTTYTFTYRPTTRMEGRFLQAIDRDNAGTWERMDRGSNDDQIFDHPFIVFDDGESNDDQERFTTFESEGEVRAFIEKVTGAKRDDQVEEIMDFHGFRDVEVVASF